MRVKVERISEASTLWVLICSALVLLMVPAIGALYHSLLSGRNSIQYVLASTFAAMVAWIQLGAYKMAFGTGNSLIGGSGPTADETVLAIAPGLPGSAFFIFQFGFLAVTLAIISGAVRVSVRRWAYWCVAWSLIGYAPIAHWVWGPGGFLKTAGIIDFAGGLVVHVASASAAVLFMIDRPPTKKDEAPAPTWTTIAAILLGWVGFNGGSALALDAVASAAVANTIVAGVVGAGFSHWVWYDRKGGDFVENMINGLVSGLVVITPVAGLVSIEAALTVGMIVGVAWKILRDLIQKLGVSDEVDILVTHGAIGIVGSLAASGLSDGDHGTQLLVQLAGVLLVMGWAGFSSFIILRAMQGVDDVLDWVVKRFSVKPSKTDKE